MNIDLHLLHGFLGTPHDWNLVFKDHWAGKLLPEDIFRARPIAPFDTWASNFNATHTTSKDRKRVLIGYSLGGRLALHALTQQPHLWDAAIFISTHPGLESANERDQRLASDNVWAQRFETEPWEPLMKAWNQQQVFSGDGVAFERKETSFCRSDLANALRVWSLGRQEPLSAKIKQIDVPILWMAGGADDKFAGIARSILLRHPLSQICIMPNSGHRLPWQEPAHFLSSIKQFLTGLE